MEEAETRALSGTPPRSEACSGKRRHTHSTPERIDVRHFF